MDMEQWMIEIPRKLEVVYKEKLETTYAVEIHTDAISLRYSDGWFVWPPSTDFLYIEIKYTIWLPLIYNVCRLCFPGISSVLLSNEVVDDHLEAALEKMAVEMGEKACVKLRLDLDTNAEEKALDFDEYSLCRALVEWEEINREKDSAKKLWIPHTQSCWKKRTKFWFHDYRRWKVRMVASPLTGIPVSWLLHFPEPPLQGLEPRLAEGIIGQEHVPFVISNALSRRRDGSCPIGSFLFLNGLAPGWKEIAQALAKQLFDDKERFIEIDLSNYSDSESVTRLFGFPSSSSYHEGCSTEGLLTKIVRPYNVVLFDNVDKAHASVIDVLIEIISHGRVSNDQGSTPDFTKTLIIMTSNVMDGKVQLWHCKCAERIREHSLKDLPSPGPFQIGHRCIYFDLLREAREHFGEKLFQKLDDVIFFKQHRFEQYMAATRLQLREIAMRTMTEKRLILYPSDAALHHICARQIGIKCVDML
ncbi:chaperone protein ClpB1-like [Cornus florida]|uniref:chaperone protein ClpB1-like n=1 Tax=Cornus florida TaxID=4283 RepID=UPI0028983589|nr:chaperone protein ClpB1-like [Cornus florida]